jgi:hypothetical protein
MIKFDLDKPKAIKTKIRTQHVDEENVDFLFKLVIEGVEYGFRGTLTEDDTVVFKIPPLREFINNVDLDSEYPVKIETIANDRFFQRPWTDSARFISAPKLELEEVTTDDDLAEEQGEGVSVESVEVQDIVDKFKKAKKEVLKEKGQKESRPEDKKAPGRKSKKFAKHIRGEALDEHTRLKQLLKEARERKNEK